MATNSSSAIVNRVLPKPPINNTTQLDLNANVLIANCKSPHFRSSHIRNLPSNKLASNIKVKQAKELGIVLEKGQTLVSSCFVGSNSL